MRTRLATFLLSAVLMMSAALYAEHEKSGGGRAPIGGPEGKGEKKSEEAEECHASPEALTEFANGENYNFQEVVHYISYSDCNAKSYIGRSLIKQIKFQDKGPYKLDTYAKQAASNDPSVADRVEKTLADRMPTLLRQYPLTTTELLPVVGQLAVLSQPAARVTMANLIAQDLFKSGKDFDLTKPGWEGNAKVLAGRLSTLGANELTIIAELASAVQQLALLVQIDSLGNFFRGLAAASGVDKSFVPAFDLSASALKQGVEGAKTIHSSAEKAKLLGAVFIAIQSAVESKAAIEVGASELNDAMDSLLAGKPLHLTALRKLWKETVHILSASPGQDALGNALAESLTQEYLFLERKEQQTLYAAAANYPEIALALQDRMIEGWILNWESVQQGKLKVAQFNKIKTNIFDPAVDSLMQLDVTSLSPTWLREVVSRGLLTDGLVEKRFPKFVLALLDEHDHSIRALASSGGTEERFNQFGKDLAAQWQLFRIYLPALFRWVDKHDSD